MANLQWEIGPCQLFARQGVRITRVSECPSGPLVVSTRSNVDNDADHTKDYDNYYNHDV